MDHDQLSATPAPDDDGVVVSLERHRRRREQRSIGHGCWLPCAGAFCLALEIGVRRPAEAIDLVSAAPPRVTA
jgi:hypothetical protein